MVTIEDKIKLFNDLIYQKIEKENQEDIKKFNEMYSNILNEKRKEFQFYINNVTEDKMKKIEDEKQKIISKAKYDQKKILLKKKQEIFEFFLDEIKIKSREYIKTPKFKEWLFKTFDDVIKGLENEELTLTITSHTYELLKEKIENRMLNLSFDEALIAGFIIEGSNKIRIDNSVLRVIEDNKEKIGEILFGRL